MTNSFPSETLSHWARGFWNIIPRANSIRGFNIDSRKIQPGEMFIALKTEKNDGHRYLADAQKAGATAALVSQISPEISLPQLLVDETLKSFHAIARFHRQSLKIPVIAIAGSYAKTTTRELLTLLLGCEIVSTSRENENNTLGVPLNLLRVDEKRHRFAILEAGINQPGEMEIISQILRPQHVIFTEISHKHVAFFPSQRELLKEKLKIAQFVIAQNGKLVLPQKMLDQEEVMEFGDSLSTVVKFSPAEIFGDYFQEKAAKFPQASLFYATEWNCEARSFRCRFRLREENDFGEECYELPVFSEGFAHNFALCRAMIHHLRITQLPLQERLHSWKALALRGEIWENAARKQYFYLDCYNSDVTPLLESMQLFLRQYAKNPITWVLGSLSEFGDHSESIHRQLGRQIPVTANQSIFLLGKEILPLKESLLARGIPEKNIRFFDSKNSLAEELKSVRGWIYLKGSRMHALETLINFDKWQKRN